jgi:hypothetical protein
MCEPYQNTGKKNLKESIKRYLRVTPMLLCPFVLIGRRIKARQIKSNRRWVSFCRQARICVTCLPAILILLNFSQIGNASPPETGVASWYSTETCRFNVNPMKCPTASGRSLHELERAGIDFAASWDHPFGTRLRVSNQENKKSVVVTVLDRGPARKLNRVIDLSRSAFSQLSDPGQGLINVKVEVLP